MVVAEHMSAEAEARPTAAGWAVLRDTVRRQRKGVATGVLAGLLWTSGKVAVPLLVQQGIDKGIEQGNVESVLRWAGLVGVVGLLAALCSGMRRYFAISEARYAEMWLRDRIYAHIQRLHFAYHDKIQAGQLMSRGNTDLQQVQNLIVMIPLTISNAVTVLAVTIIMLLVDPFLTLLALGSLPLVNVFGRMFSQRLFPSMMRLQEESAQLASVVDESVQGVRVVKGFGAERVQEARLAQEAGDVYDAAIAAARTRATYLPVMELLPNIGLVLLLLYGGTQVINGNMTVGTLVQFYFYVVLLVPPVRMLGMIIAQAQRGAAAADRVAEVLSTAPEITDARNAVALPAGERLGDVRFEGVRFGYSSRDLVLDGLDLHLAPGESVALVGATGTGKSTVAKLLPRFYDVGEGRVTIDGIDVRQVRLPELRRAVGLVFEDTFLFSDTIAANIAFADPHAARAAIERAARLAGAHDFIVAMPDGYGTQIGERGFGLSGGQRQRIAIARAVLADPRILILDDATSSVDPSKEHEIRAAMAEVMEGRTTLVIAHRPATIALADRVVLLDGGRIVADGTHVELLATDARYRAVLAHAEAAEAPDATEDLEANATDTTEAKV